MLVISWRRNKEAHAQEQCVSFFVASYRNRFVLRDSHNPLGQLFLLFHSLWNPIWPNLAV